MSAFLKLDAAAETLADVALELEAVAALVGARERTRAAGEGEGEEAVVLRTGEARGFALLLGRLADQLRQAEEEVRARLLEQAG